MNSLSLTVFKEKSFYQINKKGIRPNNYAGASSTPSQEKNLENGLVYGLQNRGNTCFMNSLIQTLSSSDYLKNDLKIKFLKLKGKTELAKQNPSLFNTKISFQLLEELENIIEKLNIPIKQNQSFNPHDLLKQLRGNFPELFNYEQQDSYELYQKLSHYLSDVHQILSQHCLQGFRSILSKSQQPNTRLNQIQSKYDSLPFQGMIHHRIGCLTCGYNKPITLTPFYDLALMIPEKITCTLDDCFYTLIETDKVEAHCRRCSLQNTLLNLKSQLNVAKKVQPHALSTLQNQIDLVEEKLNYDIEGDLPSSVPFKPVNKESSKQMMIAKPPQSLFIYLNRVPGLYVKNDCRVKFTEYFDLTPYCTNGTLNSSPKLPISTHSPATKNRYIYRLQGVVVHRGDQNNGHFVSFRRKPSSMNSSPPFTSSKSSMDWFYVNDDKVFTVSLDQVLSSNPYLLLYEQIDLHQKIVPPKSSLL